MNLIEEAIATLGIPGSIAVVIVIIFAVLQLIGEFIESVGKVAPAFLNIRKWLIRRHKIKLEEKQETAKTNKAKFFLFFILFSSLFNKK